MVLDLPPIFSLISSLSLCSFTSLYPAGSGSSRFWHQGHHFGSRAERWDTLSIWQDLGESRWGPFAEGTVVNSRFFSMIKPSSQATSDLYRPVVWAWRLCWRCWRRLPARRPVSCLWLATKLSDCHSWSVFRWWECVWVCLPTSQTNHLPYDCELIRNLWIARLEKKKQKTFFLLCLQTQEVQKAMDEKKFEEAVRLRGRYLSVTFWMCLCVTNISTLFAAFFRHSIRVGGTLLEHKCEIYIIWLHQFWQDLHQQLGKQIYCNQFANM